MDATYPPNEFIAPDGSTIVGMDADLANAITQTLGLKAKLVNATFDTIIPGIVAGKYGMGASSFTDTMARQKVVDFVDYFSAGESFYVKTGQPDDLHGLASLCGHSVAVESGTTEETDAKTQAAKCVATGKPKVDRPHLQHPERGQPGRLERPGRRRLRRLAGGRLHRRHLERRVPEQRDRRSTSPPTAWPSPRGTAWPPRWPAAVNLLIANGVYNQILTKWGVQAGAITTATINGATS